MRVFWPFIRGECMRFLSLNNAQRISIGNWYQFPMLILSALCEAKQLTN